LKSIFNTIYLLTPDQASQSVFISTAMSLALAVPTPRRPPAPAPVDFATESRTIVVTAARTEQAVGDSAVATQVIRRDAIEASGAENLAELLEEQPGLQVLRSFGGAGGAGVTMQGLDPKYTLILVDGQRATGRINGTLDLSRFPAEDIEQVEIVKGPGSALYGSAPPPESPMKLSPALLLLPFTSRCAGPRSRRPHDPSAPALTP
jgi:outer membrane receptor for ferrienterochelin and colicins